MELCFLQIDVPEEPEVFTSGKSENIWQYEQKLQEIDNEEEKKKLERQEQQSMEELKDKAVLDETYKNIDQIEPPMNKEVSFPSYLGKP